ncbi:MAG: bifunctional diaminohydroxyphosphoribosylaminopyrimidine deaminase/5-amino-6-(5-phosphoribosylamino)uracil reductase RibD [Phycisphaeraceae bacterium]|nr:bifunctional diaminohydroxyphosphoribosylaminopyrimidine deaminase/5-amino-6-(5-phosphoribosylamino)uracil reductase RibD [Phycisphaeraceae bacterium]
MSGDDPARDLDRLRRAARLALRGHGGTAPNPMVGCLVEDTSGRIVGEGYHRRAGDAHAEVVALRRAGMLARGGTMYVTLEPCAHHGRTPPCIDAIRDAGIARVVFARRDPTAAAGGGAERLRTHGVRCDLLEDPVAQAPSAPWVRRVTTGLPWVLVKWAQTIDGFVATRTGDSRWISGERSRALVHRERARSCAILTGIGTVRRDDPSLTARDVPRRRTARRVVIDPRLETSVESALVRSAATHPLTLITTTRAAASGAGHAAALARAGAEILPIDPDGQGEIPLTVALREIVRRHAILHVLVEAGPGLVSRLLREDLVQRVWVFIAPRLLGDAMGIPPFLGGPQPDLAHARRLRPLAVRRRGGDAMLELAAGDCEAHAPPGSC